MWRVSEKEYLVIAEFKLFLLVIRMVNLLKYIEEEKGTFESPRYSRSFVISEFHCTWFVLSLYFMFNQVNVDEKITKESRNK